jgi:hypothetical protein
MKQEIEMYTNEIENLKEIIKNVNYFINSFLI